MDVLLSRHDRKKWQVRVPTEKGHNIIAFGQLGAQYFTTHKDEDRKRLYLARHKPRENWEDPYTAGFWSRWLLWNKPSLRESIRALRPKGIKVKVESL